jgi:hypothetical protein
MSRKPSKALLAGAAFALGLGVVLVATVGGDRAAVEVVQAWGVARNAGDIDAAMDLVSENARLLDHSMQLPDRRDAFVDLLRVQASAGFEVRDFDCSIAGESVSCRYELNDVFLRMMGLVLTGDHEYVVHDGLIVSADRTHDPETRSVIESASRDLRQWVKEHHPELEPVIWTSRRSVTYSTVEGVEAMLSIFDEYLASK